MNKLLWIIPELLRQAKVALRKDLNQKNANHSRFLASNTIVYLKSYTKCMKVCIEAVYFTRVIILLLHAWHWWKLTVWAFSQLRICRPLPLPHRNGQLFMKYVECAKTKEKSYIIFFPFFISRVIVKIHRKLRCFELVMTITRKMKIRKIRKIDFSSVSAHSAYFMKIWILLKKKL